MSTQTSFTRDKFKTSVIATTLLVGLSLPASAGLFHKSDSAATTTSSTGSGTTSSAAPGTAASMSAGGADYLAGATDRVNKAKTQLDTAKKQLSAAKALVKAAQAEFTAAQADKEALALKTTAQGLASESGLQSGTSSTTGTSAIGDTPPPAAPMPGTASSNTPTGDIGAQDFSGAPAGTPPAASMGDQGSAPATLR